jgi:HlyD family secretion protein
MKRRLIILLTLVMAITIVGMAAFWGYRTAQPPETTEAEAPVTVPVTRGRVERSIEAPGKVVNRDEVVLTPGVGGHVTAIFARPGDVVDAGDLVVQLDTTQLEEALTAARLSLERARAEHGSRQSEARLALRIAEARLSQATEQSPSIAEATAAVAAAEAELRLAQQGPSPQALIAAQAEMANAEAALRLAQSAYDQVRHRSDIGMLPQSVELEQATNAYNAAKARYDSLLRGPEPAAVDSAQAHLQTAQARLDQVLAEQEVNAQSVIIAQAEVERARLAVEELAWGIDPSLEQAVRQAEVDLASASLTAPSDGVVVQVDARPGETVPAGSPVVVMVDPNAVEIEVTVIEEDLPLVEVGQLVEVYFDAAPDLEAISGEVARIVPERTEDARPLYPVYVSVDQMPEGIAPGMTAESAIVIDRRSEVLRLPRVLVSAPSNGSARVEVWADGQVEERSVQLGLRGDVYIEILNGLSEGEAVVGE